MMRKYNSTQILFIIISLCLLSIVCGCGSLLSDNSSKNSNILKSNLPKNIKLVDKNLKVPLFSDELQNKINYQRKDKDKQVYIRINQKNVNLYEKPAGKVKGSVINANLYEVGDRKFMDNTVWYYVKQIYYGDKGVPKVGAALNGWVKDENNINVDLYFSDLYFFDNSYEIPDVIDGTWRHIYTENFETMMFHYYIDLDSLEQNQDKIYFSLMRIETLNGVVCKNTYVDKDKTVDIFSRIEKYVYDYKKEKIYKVAEKALDNTGKVIYNNDYEKRLEKKTGQVSKGFKLPDYDPTDDGKYLYRDEDGLVYELSSREPVYTKNFNLKYSAFFKILEGR